MNYLFICVISVFLTITLSHDSRGEIQRTPYYFYYENGADLNVKVILKNKPADMDFRIYTWCSSIIREGFHKESDFFSLESRLWCPETRVSIELFGNIKGSYYKKKMIILEGRTEDQSNGTMARQIYDDTDVCFNYDTPCTIELDLKEIYPDFYINTTQTTHNAKPMTRERERTKLTNLSYSEFESNFTTLHKSRNNVFVVNGNNATTPPQYGNNATTTPQYRNNATTPPQHGNNATTTPRYRNNERTSEKTINYSNGTGEQTFSQTYIYVIVAVIAICVLLFVTCILCTKKYCLRNKRQVKTMELNTYVTANDVIYADLGLAQGNSPPPRHDDESPYAQIIGVLRPDVK